MTKPQSSPLYTVEQLAAILDQDPLDVDQLCTDGKIPGAFCLNGHWYVAVNAIRWWGCEEHRPK